MKNIIRLIALYCLYNMLVLKSYAWENKSFFYLEVLAIALWIVSEFEWYRKEKKGKENDS